MVKYHKKVNKESLSSLIFLVIFVLSFALIIPYYPSFAAEQYDRPVIDDGGNTSGGSSISKQAEKKRRDIIRDILLDLFSFGESVPIPTGTNTGNTPTTIPTAPGLSPNPGYTPILPALTDLTLLADQIVSTVRAKCIDSKIGVGSISIRNESCINSLIGIINTSAITELKFTNEERKWEYLQCVPCARAMSKARDKAFVGTADYAKNFVNVVADGYKYYENNPGNVQQHLVPGSLGIYTGGSSGHIYFITEVNRDDTGRVDSIRAFECNYGPSGSVRHDKIRSIYDKELSGWQKPI